MSDGDLRFTKDEMNELINALQEALYLINPTDEDIQKKAGVYRVVTALEKLKDVTTNSKRQADLKIGAWLSAALEDPSTCQSMKDDINEWFECTPQEKNAP